jgi:putative membrane protein
VPDTAIPSFPNDWARSIAGTSITQTFGFERNHYDRVVHFCFGILAIRPVREIVVRHFGLARPVAVYIALEFVLAFSAFYEVFEWFLAVIMNPAHADAYNGQQGDPFDSQKDMVLAALGATIGCMAVWLWEPAKRWKAQDEIVSNVTLNSFQGP